MKREDTPTIPSRTYRPNSNLIFAVVVLPAGLLRFEADSMTAHDVNQSKSAVSLKGCLWVYFKLIEFGCDQQI